jgi:hypothetical protein
LLLLLGVAVHAVAVLGLAHLVENFLVLLGGEGVFFPMTRPNVEQPALEHKGLELLLLNCWIFIHFHRHDLRGIIEIIG